MTITATRPIANLAKSSSMCQSFFGGPGGSRTRVQNTFLFASYSNNARMAFRLTPTVLGVVGSSRNYQNMYGLRVA